MLICFDLTRKIGKTTLLYQLALGETVSTKPTIGSNVEQIKIKNITLNAWDLGGQTSLRQSWSSYYVGTHGVIMVVDSVDRDRIGLVKEELWKMIKHKDLGKAVVLVFANKQDLPNKMDAAEIATELNLMGLREIEITWHIQSCCALTGEGLVEGVEWMITQLQKK